MQAQILRLLLTWHILNGSALSVSLWKNLFTIIIVERSFHFVLKFITSLSHARYLLHKTSVGNIRQFELPSEAKKACYQLITNWRVHKSVDDLHTLARCPDSSVRNSEIRQLWDCILRKSPCWKIIYSLKKWEVFEKIIIVNIQLLLNETALIVSILAKNNLNKLNSQLNPKLWKGSN